MSANLIYFPTASLQRTAIPQPGGLWDIYYTPVEHILNLPLPNALTGIVNANITLKPGKSWHMAKAPFKRSYKEEQKTAESGPYMECTVWAYLPFDASSSHLTLDRLKYHRYIVIIKRPDGSMRIIGSLDNPATFSHSTDLGETLRDQSGTTIQFTCATEDKSLLYTGTISPIT